MSPNSETSLRLVFYSWTGLPAGALCDSGIEFGQHKMSAEGAQRCSCSCSSHFGSSAIKDGIYLLPDPNMASGGSKAVAEAGNRQNRARNGGEETAIRGRSGSDAHQILPPPPAASLPTFSPWICTRYRAGTGLRRPIVEWELTEG